MNPFTFIKSFIYKAPQESTLPSVKTFAIEIITNKKIKIGQTKNIFFLLLTEVLLSFFNLKQKKIFIGKNIIT